MRQVEKTLPGNGDVDLQFIWNQYGEQLYAFLLARTRDPDLAQDLVSELLIRSQKGLPHLRDPEKISNWLYSTARNALADHYRHGRLETSIDIEDWPSIRDQALPETERIRKKLVCCLMPFIHKLPEKYRTAVMAVDIERRSQKELAREMNLSYSTLKSRVQRGRRQLRDLFGHCCTFQFDARGGIVGFTPKSKEC